MRKVAYSAALLSLACMAMAAAAQEVPAEPAGSEEPPVLCVADPPHPQPGPASQADAAATDQKPEKPSIVKDVGSAVGGTAGQLAGAAVAGPIGAAAGGVVVERVGRAVAGVVGGGKKKKQRKQAQQSAASSPIKCVAQAPAAEPSG